MREVVYMSSTAELLNLSLTDARNKMLKGEITSVELVHAMVNNAVVKNKELNAFIEITSDIAVKQAYESDERIKNGTAGMIEGIPIAIKDLFCTNGIRTTAGAKILDNFIPTYDSTVTALLRHHGGVCVGKTNLDAYGMGSTNHFSYYGPCTNPWRDRRYPDTKLVPGGSSGGSAVAVAAQMSVGALGTDTGGSIRQPAAFCGVVGIKPTYGRCSRWGVIALASSFDQPGPIAKSVEDAAILLEAISGYDPKDPTSARICVPKFAAVIGNSIRGMKIGIPTNITENLVSAEIMDAWHLGQTYLREAGAELIPIQLQKIEYGLPTYYVLMSAEASSNLERYDGIRYGKRAKCENQTFAEMIENTRTEGFGDETKRRIMLGTYVLSDAAFGAHYIYAQKVRRLVANDFAEAFKQIDAILMPTTPGTAFSMEEQQNDDPIALYMADLLTVPISLAGLPAMSIPVALSSHSGLPIGLQIVGKYYDEETIFKIGAVIEREAQFKVKS